MESDFSFSTVLVSAIPEEKNESGSFFPGLVPYSQIINILQLEMALMEGFELKQ